MGFMDNIKGFADKVGEGVKKGVQTGSDNIEKMKEKSRINKEISTCESAVNNAYVEIGKKFFAENPYAPEYAEFFTAISENTAKVEELRNQLAAMEDKIACKSCGASLAKDAKFCDKCGAKVEIPAETVESSAAPSETPLEDAKVCPTCNASVAAGSAFCAECGTKVD